MKLTSNCQAGLILRMPESGQINNPMQPWRVQKPGKKVTVWIGLSDHGVFGSHFFENEDEKADTIRTANYIAMLRGKVIQVLKRKKNITPLFSNEADPS